MSRLAQKYARYYVGEGKLNPHAQEIANAELFGQGKELAPGQGGGFLRTLEAALTSSIDYRKAQTEKMKRETLALRHKAINQALQLVSATKNGNSVAVQLTNTSYFRINDIFSLTLQVGKGNGGLRVVQQVNGGIPPRSTFIVQFRDPRFENLYFSSSDVSVAIDSVIEARY